jgi:alpha-1,6-mannosyltransferase
LFTVIRTATSPPMAAAAAVILRLLTAGWCRWKLEANDPAAWAWPMAVALACAPVIYPWYLLAFTPFLLTRDTLPLIVWTVSIIPAYMVWELARHGGSWVVPRTVMACEYGTVAIAALVLLWWKWRRSPTLSASRSTG